MEAHSSHQTNGVPVRILSFDGAGGCCALSAFFILNQLMLNAGTANEPARPSQLFDFIIGSSTGGIAALMLGSLGMGMEEANTPYLGFGAELFRRRGAESISNGELLEHFVDKHGRRKKLLNTKICRTVVTTTIAILNTAASPILLRSYESVVASTPFGHQWSITEAARATSATPQIFEPFSITVEGSNFPFYDASLSTWNNPVRTRV